MGGGGGYTCMSDSATTAIENFMVTHDAYQRADENLLLLGGQASELVIELEKEGVMEDFHPLGLTRDYLDKLILEGLR